MNQHAGWLAHSGRTAGRIARATARAGMAALFGLALTAGTASAGFIAFTDAAGPHTFTVPAGVTSLTVLTVGGGGGGANGHQGGGGSGFVAEGTFSVTPGDIYNVIVGAGGHGAAADPSSNGIVGLTPGGASFFGSLVTSAGGGVVAGVNLGGHNGGSGGGAACNGGSLAGDGGSGGGDGQACQAGASMPIGFGQGAFAALLSPFVENALTAGAGGAGGTGTHAGGGGAGGVLLGGAGPSAGDGGASFSGHGGMGYGAGGGAGGLNQSLSDTRFGGGDGASGLVYVEFAEVPEPVSAALFGVGLLGLAAARRRVAARAD